MSDGHTEMQLRQQATPPAPADDGWAAAAAEAGERMIRGSILRFADWHFRAGKEGTIIEVGTQLVAMATTAMWVRWEGGKPVEYRQREANRRLPDRDELGFTDEDEWEEGPSGEKQDPWANTRLVYLIDPQTAEAFTFSTSSWGGRSAVNDLGDQITRMRTVHHDAVPIVALMAVEMPTRFGRKSKPQFKVVGWRTGSGEKLPPARQITARKAEQEVREGEMDDEIPF